MTLAGYWFLQYVLVFSCHMRTSYKCFKIFIMNTDHRYKNTLLTKELQNILQKLQNDKKERSI